MRAEVKRLVELGPLPTEEDYNEERFAEYERLIRALVRPATDEEAAALLGVFGPEEGDSCYGLAWALLHFIETAPNWPVEPPSNETARDLEKRLRDSQNPWVQYLWRRITNARREFADRP